MDVWVHLPGADTGVICFCCCASVYEPSRTEVTVSDGLGNIL